MEKIPSSYLQLSTDDVSSRIREARLKLGPRAVVLVHHFQRDDVARQADFLGSSTELLARVASLREADYLVLCGNRPLAEMMDILRDSRQKLLLVDEGGVCSMVASQVPKDYDGIVGELKRAGTSPVVPVVTDHAAIGVTARAGEAGGALCTPGNAGAVLRWALGRGRVLFTPDRNLGYNAARRSDVLADEIVDWKPGQPLGGNAPALLRKARVILWGQTCAAHSQFKPEHVRKLRQRDPGIRILVHPSSPPEVVALADEVGASAHITRTVENAAPGSRWGVGAHRNLVNRLAARFKDRQVLPLVNQGCLCSVMIRNEAARLLWVLDNLVAGREVNRVTLHPDVLSGAMNAVIRMMEIQAFESEA
ncbi:MAG: quinolinate synthase NadA [Acidobacteria bacterium]|nr:quinolinate synthase NadA [Acidobacteriota bacterium]